MAYVKNVIKYILVVYNVIQTVVPSVKPGHPTQLVYVLIVRLIVPFVRSRELDHVIIIVILDLLLLLVVAYLVRLIVIYVIILDLEDVITFVIIN